MVSVIPLKVLYLALALSASGMAGTVFGIYDSPNQTVDIVTTVKVMPTHTTSVPVNSTASKVTNSTSTITTTETTKSSWFSVSVQTTVMNSTVTNTYLVNQTTTTCRSNSGILMEDARTAPTTTVKGSC